MAEPAPSTPAGGLYGAKSEWRTTGAAGAGYNSTHHANHELAALSDIDTPERVFANLFADVDAARWILLIVMIFTSLLAYTMLMILEKDAGIFAR